MMQLLLAAALPAGLAGNPPGASAGNPEVTWDAPASYVTGGAYKVHLEFVAPDGGTTLIGWLLTPAAFSIDDKPLAPREDRGSVQLPKGAVLTLDVDLAPFLKERAQDFTLDYAKEYLDGLAREVKVLVPAPKGLNFMEMPPEQLGQYAVVLSTNRGDMTFEFWPDTAPNHVRNFLDLSYTGFYDGTLFHRVGPNFMIQGGDPNTKQDDPSAWGRGSGPRTLDLEASDRPDRAHVRGVLSMARTANPNSATSQFFVMHGANPGLDRGTSPPGYTSFGKLVSGYDTLDKIANAEAGQRLDQATHRPKNPQRILTARVVVSGAAAAAGDGADEGGQ